MTRIISSFLNDQLKTIVERIERLEEEKNNITADIKEVYSEAKGNGFDIKILRKVIALRKKEAAERQEEEAMIDVYCLALGMQPSLFDNKTEIDYNLETGEISQTPSQALIAIESVTERDGGVDAAVAAEAANKTLATQGEVDWPSAPPPEPIPVSRHGEAAGPVGEIPESSVANIDAGTIPEFLKRVA